ncbi:serine hydrolase domain-containing protein [Streptomyces sp. NPDC054864]
MTDPAAGRWQARLEELARRHDVPGASLGILTRDGGVQQAVTGLANVDAGIEATTDTLWQIGSVSKVWTATLTMMLVDEGLLDLDERIVSYLPELSLAEEQLTKGMTARHLLTHTSGIDGDFFADTGRGDDCLEKYVHRLAQVGANHPLGATMSYCNAGYVLLGHLQERVTGVQWDRLLRERLLEPLGLTHTVTLPEDALRFRTAAGHIGDPPQVAPQWSLMRSLGPAGLICSTARDVLAFARLHLDDGLTADGTRLLSASSAEAMRTPQVELPDPYLLGDAWGLGWILCEWDGRRLYGHDGNTLGQSGFLRVLPDAGLGICLLANGGDTQGLYQDLFEEICAEHADLTMPRPLAPPDHPVPVDTAAYVGVYERTAARIEVREREGRLMLNTRVTGELAELVDQVESEDQLHPVSPGVFVTHREGARDWVPAVFYELPDGARYLHHGARATRRVG